MVQKTFFVRNIADLENAINQVIAVPEYKHYSDVMALVFANGIGNDKIAEYIDVIRDSMPDIKVSGISVIKSVKKWNDIGLSISFFIFNTSKADLLTYKCIDWDEDAIIKDLSHRIDTTPFCKVALSFPVGNKTDFTKILEEVSKDREEVVFWGASAIDRSTMGKDGEYWNPMLNAVDRPSDAVDTFDILNWNQAGITNSFAIGHEIIHSGVVFMLLSGEELRETARYLLGWHPIGREIEITGRLKPDDAGNACITELDGMPAADIYKKYLDVDADEYFLDNVCEFPLVLDRNGSIIARVPSLVGEEKELYFSGDIRNGEKLRFSYAKPSELLDMTQKAAEHFCEFKPEATLMAMCFNRFHFLKSEQDKEIDHFVEHSPDCVFMFGGYEILKGNNCGGVLNSAIVVLGLREGESTKFTGETIIAPPIKKKGSKPLSERLLTFIETTTEELGEALIAAEKANNYKSAFLSNMSHEIRTPINAITGMDEMILRECSDENITQYALDIKNASNSLLGIVNDILDFSKIEAGKMEIVPVEYEISSVLNDLVNMIRKRAEDKGLRLNINVDTTIPHLLYGDEIRLKQVITNILTNAVKYTKKGGVVLSVKWKDCCITTDGKIDAIGSYKRCPDDKAITLEFAIEDTGIGIKEEDLPKLFNSFERIDLERNRTVEGTGLGMSITQNLLKLMGSELKVQSHYGTGSIFSFELVQKVVDPAPIGNLERALKRSMEQSKMEYKESFVAPSARLLVVDDTEINLTVFANLLKQTKVQIDKATSGFECLDLIKDTKYDIIFLDHRMPKMDGMECLNRIKADKTGLNFTTPIVALTANAVSGSREMYLDAGFTDYLTKPIVGGLLEQMIIKYLPDDLVTITEANGNDDSLKLPEWIDKVAFIDSTAGVNNCGGVSEFMDAIKVYLDSVDDVQRDIIAALKEDRLKDYTTKVHALKSSSRIIGALDIGDLAEKLEIAGNDNDLDVIGRYTEELLSYHKTLGFMLKNGFGQTSNQREEKKEMISADKLQEAYNAIKEVAASFDYDSLEMIMASLDDYEIMPEEKERFGKLKDACNKADWDTIIQLMKG